MKRFFSSQNRSMFRSICLWSAFPITSLLVMLPAYAHHPWDSLPQTFNAFEGILSGLAHPVIGIDHLLFLVSIGLLGGLSVVRWVPLLLSCGMVGTVLSQFLPVSTSLDLVIGLTLIASASICLGKLRSFWIAPLIACHGYVLGQSIVGAEPTPLFAYLIGLIISEAIVVTIGIIIFRYCSRIRNYFAVVLIAVGCAMAMGAILPVAYS